MDYTSLNTERGLRVDTGACVFISTDDNAYSYCTLTDKHKVILNQ